MEWLGTALTALGSMIAGLGAAWFLFRGRKVDQSIAETGAEVETKKVETTAAAEFLKGQQAFQSYIDELLDKRVDEALAEAKQRDADLRAEMGAMRAEMGAMRTESKELHAAVRSRETQLWLWNIRGRIGPMPEFPAPILEKLHITHLSGLSGLGDIEDTQPARPTPDEPTT